MREIRVDLPEWCEGRHIYILAGIELVAYQLADKPMLVKTARCSMCGKCCEDCKELIPDGSKLVCGLAIDRPFRCCIGRGLDRNPDCTERFE